MRPRSADLAEAPLAVEANELTCTFVSPPTRSWSKENSSASDRWITCLRERLELGGCSQVNHFAGHGPHTKLVVS